MRSSAPEGQHAPRAKQAPPSGSSGAIAGSVGATPPSPHSNTSSSPRPQSSAGLSHKSSSAQPQPRGSALAAQGRVGPPQRGVASHPQLQRTQQRPAPAQAQQQRSPPNSAPAAGSKPLTPLPKGIQQRLSQVHQPKTPPQALSKSQGSFGSTQGPPQQQQQPPAAAQASGVKSPAAASFKQGSPSAKAQPPPPNFGEYDDQEWDVGVGHLIIDLDADIAQADRGRMSGAGAPSAPHQGGPGSEDKHSLKMKIKRTKPPTKTSEAKHEIVKPDAIPATGGAVVMVTGAQTNGPPVKVESVACPRGAPPVPSRTVYKKDKRRVDVNGTTPSPPPSGGSITPRNVPHAPTPSLPHSSTTGTVMNTTLSTPHSTPVVTLSAPSSQQGVSLSSSVASTPSGAHHFTPIKSELPPSTPAGGRLPPSALPQPPTPAPSLQLQPPSAPPPAPTTNSSQSHDSPPQPQLEISGPAPKKLKVGDEGTKRDACVGTSVATITEPDCLGPCEPGSSVTLEGIVWHETEGGVLVVNVTWRGKTYVGTLLDCTKHDWAPPRFCDSPTSDLESRTPKGRGKRGRAAASSSTSSSFNSASATHTPTTEMNVTETRSGKLRNASVKGRRGAATPNFNPPLSPVKTEVGGTKRKGRDGESAPPPDSKMAKRARSTSRGTPTNGCGSPVPDQQPPSQSPSLPQTQPQHPSNSSDTPPQPPTSPQLIECPEPNCNKKYKHINGLKYHQSHAHSASQVINEDESSAGDSRGESSEVEDTRQSSPPSPTLLVSTPVDSSSQDLVKPAVLRPTAPANPDKADISPLNLPQSILLPQQPSVSSVSAAKSPQHLYVYSSNLGTTGLQKQSGNGSPSLRPPISTLQQNNSSITSNPSLAPNQDAQWATSNQSKPELAVHPPHSSPDRSSQHQPGVVILSSSQIPTSHPLILAQPKPQHLQTPSHSSQQSAIQLTHSQPHPTQGQGNNKSAPQQHPLQHIPPQLPQSQQHHQQIQITQSPSQQQDQQSPQPPQQHQQQQPTLQQHQLPSQQQQPPLQPQQQQQQQTQPQMVPSSPHQQLSHHPLQQPVTLPPPHSVHSQATIVSQFSIHTTQPQTVHGLQQKSVATLLPGQQGLSHNHAPQLPCQPGGQQQVKQTVPPNTQQQHPLKPHPSQSSHQPVQQSSQIHTPSVYHHQLHDLASQQISQQPPPQQRIELKPEMINRITPLHGASQLVSSTRPSPIGAMSDSASVAPAAAITSTALPIGSVPQGTPLSSLSGSSIATLKVKTSTGEEKLVGKPKDMVNGLLPKKEDEHIEREDARSPAYSDISDANDTAPVIDEDVDSKDFKDEKKPDLPIGSAPPYAYGLYFGSYGQPPHPYLMPPLQHPQGVPLKPVDAKDLKEKGPEKEKKDFLPIPGGSDYMKFPPQYLYSYSHLYPPGYPDPYLRDPLYKEIVDKPKVELEDCTPIEEGDKGPTDLSRSATHLASTNAAPADKNPLILKEAKNSSDPLTPSKEPFEPRSQVGPEKRQVDTAALAYRYIGGYDTRIPVVASPLEKSLDGKVPIIKPSTPVPLTSPRLGSTPPTNNGMNKEEKSEKRPEVKSEGVKPTMETTGPPPPPTSSAYYPPFPYAHVPFDPYRPAIVPGMSLPAGFPPYLAAPPHSLGGLRYQLGVPNGPEDLSPGGTGAAILTSSLYPGSHKIAELQERVQKSPSSQVSSAALAMSSRGASPLTLIASNPLSMAPPHSLSHMVSSPSFSSSSGIFTNSIAVQQGSLMSAGHFGDRKTPPMGPRLPPHPSLPEGYPYPLLPAQFPPHFTALGVSPTALPSVGVGGPVLPPSGMGGAAPPPK